MSAPAHAGYRASCEVANKRLEAVSINNQADDERFTQVRCSCNSRVPLRIALTRLPAQVLQLVKHVERYDPFRGLGAMHKELEGPPVRA